ETTRSIELEVECAEDGYVVLSDAAFPGWTAMVDGEKADVLIANYAFRAVRVPAGKHTVFMTFLPRAILVGGAISFSVFLLCLVGIVFTWWASRARSPRRTT